MSAKRQSSPHRTVRRFRVLLRMAGGSMARCSRPPFAVARAAAHGSMDEFSYCPAGRGRIWLHRDDRDAVIAVIAVTAGMSVAIPAGVSF